MEWRGIACNFEIKKKVKLEAKENIKLLVFLEKLNNHS